MRKEQQELSPEECDLVHLLAFYSHQYNLKTVAKELKTTEEQVRENLSKLGLLDVISRERVAERKRIHALNREAWEALARAAREGEPR